jgi:hypothetical protein
MPGLEAVWILRRRGDKFRIASDYLGVFAVRGGRVEPLGTGGGFGHEHRGEEVGAFVRVIVKTLKEMGRL